jgi:hypothetical protein
MHEQCRSQLDPFALNRQFPGSAALELMWRYIDHEKSGIRLPPVLTATEGFDRPRAAFAPLRRHHVGLKPSPQLAPACDPPLFYYSIQLRIGFSSAMAAFSMQKDQRLLPALRHLGDSESTDQNADTTGSTLSAFHLSISSGSAPIFLAHYSLTN